ncbi:MAG: hypothetical protein QM483_04635 [Desulfuromusa sp.]
MKKIIRLTVINAGGEFTGGFVSDADGKENLRESIDNGSVSSSLEFDDGTYFEATDYGDILSNYGPRDKCMVGISRSRVTLSIPHF